ncbi:Cytochrome b ascorbate-dependent protein [Schistosoma japonicum]|uniref:Cytochrome b ascorbate-dependent protein n=1 Tax=Schistosoma japonicum TaxID=6182 RepID=A0A4Z2CVT0_SCHJA|nr:Cytochrome b ascorbate-dependent protein [Schistosoma japonicum]
MLDMKSLLRSNKPYINHMLNLQMDGYNPVESPSGSPKSFIYLVIASQAKFWGGFSWTEPRQIFNYHVLFSVLGLVFLYGDSILVFRVFRSYRKLPVKILHAVLHILAFLFGVLGIKAAFDMHNALSIPNLYSLHSWLGITAIVVFGLQWVGGLIGFLVPQTPQIARSKLLPIHVTFGSFLYLLMIGVCISGITEKNFFSKNYSVLNARELIGNLIGVVLVIFGGLIFYLTHHPNYRRIEPVPPECTLQK